jgi:hypothetical protein
MHMVLNNDSRWIDFPKRSKSLICTTNYSDATSYGMVYRVIPLIKNEFFGICPKSDIFDVNLTSLSKIINMIDAYEGSTLRDINRSICNHVNIKNKDDYNTMKIKINNYYKRYWLHDEDVNIKLKKLVVEYGSFFNLIVAQIDPYMNGFNLLNYNELTKISGSKEVWTDAKCLLINEDIIQPRRYSPKI